MSNDNAVTPLALKKVAESDSARSRRQATQLKQAKDEGYREGLTKGHSDLLDFLQTAYIKHPDRPNRDSPEAKAILSIARDAASHFKALQEKATRAR